ncbi:hypothetical protein FGIG_10710 [Fasciola gigantica]|uniref:Uncharacterized protein n=1 Tax=Fasciola gigantica TaxID=46835 RepID=A0A504Y8U2_FASGI|nr:hypothetical protein FGIG_10710 [Fasciola gigantica]
MVRMLITDAHNRMNKCRNIMTEVKCWCERIVDSETIKGIEAAIGRRVTHCQKRKRSLLARELEQLTRGLEETENKTWVNNFSSWPLSTKEHKVLQKGLNFNPENATTREFLAELEHALKSSGLPEDTKCKPRQIIVPNMFHNRPFNALSDTEHRALQTLKSKG